MKTKITLGILLILALTTALTCSKDELKNIEPKQTAGQYKAESLSIITDGRADLILPTLEPIVAYYDKYLFNIQLTQLLEGPVTYEPPQKINAAVLYVYDQDLHSTVVIKKEFYLVCSAMADPDKSLLYNKVVISFMPGYPKRQFYTDKEILLASGGIHPTITLTPTEEFYTGRLYNVAKQPNPLIPRSDSLK